MILQHVLRHAVLLCLHFGRRARALQAATFCAWFHEEKLLQTLELDVPLPYLLPDMQSLPTQLSDYLSIPCSVSLITSECYEPR